MDQAFEDEIDQDLLEYGPGEPTITRLAKSEQLVRELTAENRALKSWREFDGVRIAELEAELAEAREDSNRLDYLEGEMAYERRCIEHGQLIPSSLFRRNVPITRAAIDAARGKK